MAKREDIINFLEIKHNKKINHRSMLKVRKGKEFMRFKFLPNMLQILVKEKNDNSWTVYSEEEYDKININFEENKLERH